MDPKTPQKFNEFNIRELNKNKWRSCKLGLKNENQKTPHKILTALGKMGGKCLTALKITQTVPCGVT